MWQNQVILIDKPYGWTSFQALKKVKYLLKVSKIGHAGTLDPLATGLLILCTGNKTKEIPIYQAQEKEYIGTLVLGKTTPSIDLETTFDSETSTEHLQIQDVEAILPCFLGEILQVPPLFSAIRKDGKRLYELARKGETTDISPRKIHIYHLEITNSQNFPEIDFRVVCSKGTYIRSLVRDIGEKLGVGAYLKSLCRTRIGEFNLQMAWKIPDLEQNIKNFNEWIKN
ncbi:MAG: tRNA pseudouridine(55) synthase TruB [Raineya sp.]|nr:tRNA pseudouridine(55) synthase TruB [Raineya sp.]MDW8295879.1 tRNA pseudouridine(55) synthase TruB [Raineya sp.]